MHRPENFIYIIGGECADLLVRDQHLIEIVEKRIGLKQIGIQHTFH